MTDYQTFINTGPHPDESATWVEGDILEWGGGGVDPDYQQRLRFVRLDPDDPIGFYAADLDEPGEPVSRGWTRGRFVKVGETPESLRGAAVKIEEAMG